LSKDSGINVEAKLGAPILVKARRSGCEIRIKHNNEIMRGILYILPQHNKVA
jgi:hypothetical protein